MCEFLSAVRTTDKNGKDKYYFLTYNLIHNTPRGELLQAKYGGDDLFGHSAIREYFELDDKGENWEQTDFSTPKNFPSVIVKAIKCGEFRGFLLPRGLLSQPLDDDYNAKRKPLNDDYNAKCKPLDDDYNAKRKLLTDDYNAKCKLLTDDYWELFTIPENRAELWR